MDKLKTTLVYIFCIALWFILYCSGIIVGTKVYRDQLNGLTGASNDVWWLLWCWIVVLLNYSVTNIGVLCCLASVIGGLTHQQKREHVPKLISRGLFVYLVFVSSTILIDSTTISDIGRDKYVRLATLLSFFSYVVGYSPELFEAMMTKSKGRAQDAIDNGNVDTQGKGGKNERSSPTEDPANLI